MRPRVLFLTTSYPSAETPVAGVFVLEHARAVGPHADVAVVHLDRRRDVRRLEVVRDADSEFPTWRVRYPYRPTALSALAHVVSGVIGYRAVRRAGFEPDVIHAHFFLSAVPGALLSAAYRVPLVETEQWTIFLSEDPARLSLPLRWAARLSLRRARLVMPVSESLARAMRDAGVRGPFRVVPNAVDTALFRPIPRDEPRRGVHVLTVGLLSPQKGIDVLIEAFARVRRAVPDARLEIVGDGAERQSYERLARRVGLADAVTFRGLQPKEEIAESMRRSDLFVLASRFDNNPCVLVEAQASGLPIVATRVGGIPEVVDGAGFLAERDDVDGLAAQIERALLEVSSFEPDAIARRARERYSAERVGRAFADVYREVCWPTSRL